MFKKFKQLLIPAIAILFMFSACEELTGLSDSEIADGLKEALRVSTDTSVSLANVENGYYSNLAIKIFLPSEVEKVSDLIKTIPGGPALMDELVLKLNRAAEDAAGEAKPIFIDAITGITITDALGILNGTDSAATVYLKERTFVDLKSAFKPKIETSLSKVGAQQAWDQLITKYNDALALPGVSFAFPNAKPINTDLADYTTDRGLKGLFYLVAEEEKEIRNDVTDRVTDLLRRVFAKQD